MSTIQEYNYKLEGNKMLIYLTLKVPLQFEIDLQGMQDIDFSKFDNCESFKTAINANSDLIINKINQDEITGKLQVLSHINEFQLSLDNLNNQEKKLANSLEQDSLNTQFNSEEKPQRNQRVISNTNKKGKVDFADLLNNSLTLAVNFVGTILFLGKLANYSWD